MSKSLLVLLLALALSLLLLATRAWWRLRRRLAGAEALADQVRELADLPPFCTVQECVEAIWRKLEQLREIHDRERDRRRRERGATRLEVAGLLLLVTPVLLLLAYLSHRIGRPGLLWGCLGLAALALAAHFLLWRPRPPQGPRPPAPPAAFLPLALLPLLQGCALAPRPVALAWTRLQAGQLAISVSVVGKDGAADAWRLQAEVACEGPVRPAGPPRIATAGELGSEAPPLVTVSGTVACAGEGG